jgi:hypothetical protein
VNTVTHCRQEQGILVMSVPPEHPIRTEPIEAAVQVLMEAAERIGIFRIAGITVTVYSTFHSSCACRAVSRSARGIAARRNPVNCHRDPTVIPVAQSTAVHAPPCARNI